MKTLGALPGHTGSQGLDINNAGQVVGDSGNGSISHAFLWTSAGGMQDLGDLPGGDNHSQGLAINDAGEVVGVSYSDAGRRAYLWTSANGMRDINTLLDGSGAGWILEDARAINNAGQIAGGGYNPAGQYHAFLLTPVPEPSAVVVIAWALCYLPAARLRFSRDLSIDLATRFCAD
jgi:probable HAF family extracellular repeat protein